MLKRTWLPARIHDCLVNQARVLEVFKRNNVELQQVDRMFEFIYSREPILKLMFMMKIQHFYSY